MVEFRMLHYWALPQFGGLRWLQVSAKRAKGLHLVLGDAVAFGSVRTFFSQVNWRNVEEVLMFADSNIQVGDDGGRGGSVGVGGCWWTVLIFCQDENCNPLAFEYGWNIFQLPTFSIRFQHVLGNFRICKLRTSMVEQTTYVRLLVAK